MNDYTTIAQEFLAATTMAKNASVPKMEGAIPPSPEKTVIPGTKMIPLPEPELLPDIPVNFLEIVELRASVRQYSKVPLTIKELSYLLWCTQGVKMGLPKGASKRNVPSAGARHAFETYLFIQNVKGIKPGLYRYLAFEHALVPLKTAAEMEEAFCSCFRAQNMAKNNAVTFVWSAVPERMTYLFGSRAYRYLFLDAGHVCQNLYLAGQAVKIGVCALGAYDDDKLNEVLGLDGKTEFAIYGATVGKL